MPRLLIACGEPLGAQMAGPAIRSLELARVVAAAGAHVTLAAPAGAGVPPLIQGVDRVPLSRDSLRAELRQADCVFAGGSLLSRFPELVGTSKPLAVDLYDPVPFEAAEIYRDAPPAVVQATLAETAAELRLELRRADVIFCASERQRDLWIGGLLAAGRLDPAAYRDDPTLASLLRVVPFGVPAGRPQRDGTALRGVIGGIAPADTVALWAGGLHDWFDPELVVAAVARLAPELPTLRLVFMGAAPPNQVLQQHVAAERARAAAVSAGLLGEHVFFMEGWRPYGDRGAYLADADIGVSAHRDTAEARFAWRTRLLDHVWARLPTVATSGDSLSELLAARGAAAVAPPGDVEAFAAALRTMVADAPARDRASSAADALASELAWDVVAKPLVDWVQHPVRTAGAASAWSARAALWRMYATKAVHVARTEGVGAVRRRARRYRDEA